MRIGCFVVVVVTLARFGPAAGDDARPPPKIDLRDLPPIPDVVAADDAGSSIAVFAASLTNEDVVVGAAKREQSLGSVASAVTVVSGDRLRRFGYRTVAEALRSVAGLYVVDDRMSSRLGIRGLQLLGDFNTRILVLIDGATLNEPWNQFVGIGEDLPVSIDDIDRVEVVRGPVSSVYGTNAFFGIINVVTIGADRSSRSYGRASLGSFGTYGAGAGFAAGSVNRQLRGSVAYQTRRGEALDVPELRTSADGGESLNASLVAHYDGAFAQVRAYRKVRELAGAPYGTVIDDRRNQNVDQMIMAEGGYTRDLSKHVTLSARGYLNRYQFQDYLVYEPSPNFRDIGDSTWFGAELRAHFKLLDHDLLGATTGLELTSNDVTSHSFAVGDEANGITIPTRFNAQGVYTEVDSTLRPWLSLSGGFRFDRNSLFEDKLSPRLALLLHDGERYGLKLLYARGFRNPSPIEAFFQDGMNVIANPMLRPETIASYEAVLWGRPVTGMNLRFSAFRWDLGQLLQQQAVVVDGVEQLQFQNVAEARSQGFEAEASYRDTAGWYAFGSATLAFVERDGRTENALNAPEVVAAGGASTPLLFRLFHLSSELLFIGARRTRDPSAMIEARQHVTWNLALYLPAWRDFDLTLGVRNLLGDREDIPAQGDYDRAATPLYLIPGEGREIYARLGYRY
jgi:outer membrane receptor for ferrienterochelin and colicins